MTFQITIDVYGKSYRMTVEKIYHGDSIEKYKVTGGSKKIVVQNNRPELQKKKSKKAVKWQILEGDVDTIYPKKTAMGILRITEAIELYTEKIVMDKSS